MGKRRAHLRPRMHYFRPANVSGKTALLSMSYTHIRNVRALPSIIMKIRRCPIARPPALRPDSSIFRNSPGFNPAGARVISVRVCTRTYIAGFAFRKKVRVKIEI